MNSVVRILNYVESNGFSCFAAFRNLQHGRDAVANYNDALKKAIDHCSLFLFISSANSRRFSCDAFSKELIYVRDCEMKRNPECRTYEQIPNKYRKLRVEYRLDNAMTRATDRDMREFFSGLTYVEDLDTLIDRLAEALSPSNLASINDEPTFGEDEINRRVEEALRKKAEEEAKAKAEAEAKAKAEAEKRRIDEEINRRVAEALQKRAEEEAKAKAEAEAKAKAEAKRKAEEEAKQRNIDDEINRRVAEALKKKAYGKPRQRRRLKLRLSARLRLRLRLWLK